MMKTRSLYMRINHSGQLERYGERREKLTVRIPTILKQKFEAAAEARQVSLGYLLTEAMEFHIDGEPPLWCVNLLAGHKPHRQPQLAPPLEIQMKLAKLLVFQSPGGIDASEVARETGQSVADAFATLTKLTSDGVIVAHGRRSRRVWTPPGAKPASRVSAITALVLKTIVEAGTVDHMTINEKIAELSDANGWKVNTGIPGLVLSKLVRRRLSRRTGVNARGVLYEIVKKGDSDRPVLN